MAGRAIRGTLLENKGDGDDHRALIHRQLADAARFHCVTAFATISGFRLIRKRLERRVASGMRATFVFGLHFGRTDPEVIGAVLRLRERHADAGLVKVYMGRLDSPATMHPKLYMFTSLNGWTTVVVGSANLTSGGLRDNHEFSAVMNGRGTTWVSEVEDWIGRQLDDGELLPADEELVRDYAESRRKYLSEVGPVLRKAERHLIKSLDATELRRNLENLRQDRGAGGWAAQLADRRERRTTASNILKTMTRSRGMTRDRFLANYEKLVDSWCSSNLKRAATTVADHGDAFRAALRTLDQTDTMDAGEAFEVLRTGFEHVRRAGVNVITEILHNRDPGRFAVMNGNSLHGLQSAGAFRFSGMLSKKSVDDVSSTTRRRRKRPD